MTEYRFMGARIDNGDLRISTPPKIVVTFAVGKNRKYVGLELTEDEAIATAADLLHAVQIKRTRAQAASSTQTRIGGRE